VTRARKEFANEIRPDKHYDAAIIGVGQAGLPPANRLIRAGRTVAMIERGLFGGACVNTGYMPTKTLVASAYAAHLAARGRLWNYDRRFRRRRKDTVSHTASKNIESWLESIPCCTIFRDHARFASPCEPEVGTERPSADIIFINVGARAEPI